MCRLRSSILQTQPSLASVLEKLNDNELTMLAAAIISNSNQIEVLRENYEAYSKQQLVNNIHCVPKKVENVREQLSRLMKEL